MSAEQIDKTVQILPDVFPACVVTRAASRSAATDKSVESTPADGGISWPGCILSVSQGELIEEQKADSTLNALFSQVMSDASAAQGYFICEGVLIRKWTPQAKAFLKETVVQVVVPIPLRSMVLRLAHDDVSGHLGVKKTYDRIMHNFFWPHLNAMFLNILRPVTLASCLERKIRIRSPFLL